MVQNVVGIPCLTKNNNTCKFPFKWDQESHNKCLKHETEDGYWCAIYVNEKQHIEKWDFCEIKNKEEKEFCTDYTPDEQGSDYTPAEQGSDYTPAEQGFDYTPAEQGSDYVADNNNDTNEDECIPTVRHRFCNLIDGEYVGEIYRVEFRQNIQECADWCAKSQCFFWTFKYKGHNAQYCTIFKENKVPKLQSNKEFQSGNKGCGKKDSHMTDPCCKLEENVEYQTNGGADLQNGLRYGRDDCANWCSELETCKYWTFYTWSHECYLKTHKGTVTNVEEFGSVARIISGNKGCGEQQCQIFEGQYWKKFSRSNGQGRAERRRGPNSCANWCDEVLMCDLWNFRKQDNMCFLLHSKDIDWDIDYENPDDWDEESKDWVKVQDGRLNDTDYICGTQDCGREACQVFGTWPLWPKYELVTDTTRTNNWWSCSENCLKNPNCTYWAMKDGCYEECTYNQCSILDKKAGECILYSKKPRIDLLEYIEDQVPRKIIHGRRGCTGGCRMAPTIGFTCCKSDRESNSFGLDMASGIAHGNASITADGSKTLAECLQYCTTQRDEGNHPVKSFISDVWPQVAIFSPLFLQKYKFEALIVVFRY